MMMTTFENDFDIKKSNIEMLLFFFACALEKNIEAVPDFFFLLPVIGGGNRMSRIYSDFNIGDCLRYGIQMK